MEDKRTLNLSIRGVNYAVDVVQSTQEGADTLLLLHGFTGSKSVYHPFISHWKKHFHLVIPDLLGHGASASPNNPDRYTMEETTADLAAILRTLNVASAHILGYSMGGRIGLGFTATHPELIRHMILEGASPGLDSLAERQERLAADERLAQSIVDGGVEAFVRYWEHIPLFESQWRLPVDILERQRTIRLSQSAVGLAASLRGIGTGRQPSYWPILPQISARALLVTGQLDTKFTKLNRMVAELMPRAKHVVVDDSGHTPHMERPDGFSQMVLSFLCSNA